MNQDHFRTPTELYDDWQKQNAFHKIIQIQRSFIDSHKH